jgi:hypothetical protein
MSDIEPEGMYGEAYLNCGRDGIAEVTVCYWCGAMVWHQSTHTEWHLRATPVHNVKIKHAGL